MAQFATIDQLYALKGTERVQRISADPEQTEGALVTASATVSSYLLSRYSRSELPRSAAETPAQLVEVACNLALRTLAGSQQVVEEEILEAHKEALRYLRDVSNGVVDLGLVAGPPTDDSRPQVISVTGPEALTLGNGGLDQW